MTHVVGDPGHTADHNTIEATQATHTTQIAALPGTYAPIAVSGRAAGVTAYTGQGRVQTDAGTILQAWYAELANRHYSPVDIAVVGDSITEGMGATAFDNRWIARLRDALRNRFPTTGLGNAGGRGYISFRKTGETSFTWPVTLANDPGINEDYGPKRAITGAFSNGTQTATASLTYTEFDVMWLRNAGFGVSYVTVDGGAPATINQAGALLDGATFRVTGGGGTAHTVVFGWSSGGSLYADGFIEYNGDLNKGIRVHDCGHYGYNTGSWVAGGQGNTQWPAAVAKLGKSLILMPIGINDVNAGLTAAQTQANITTMIAAIRGGYTGGGYTYGPPPIVLIPYWARSGEESLWPDHVAAMYAAAAADTATVVCDLFARFPSGTANTGSIYADGLHPNDKGASMVADAVLQFLTP